MNIHRIVQLMQERQVASRKDLVGVSLTEIQTLQQHLGIKFPTSYSQFLQAFGRSAGLLSPWRAIYFDDLLEIREEFETRLTQLAKPFDLPSEALIIAQAEELFDYLFCDGSEDPPVYRIKLLPDSAFCERCAPAFSDYLEALVMAQDQEAVWDDLAGEETYSLAHSVKDDEQLL